MRAFLLLALFALTLPATGCAALIAASGRDPAELTEQNVRAEHPDAVVTVADDGTSSLAFRTREKIADQKKMYPMGYAMTLGFGEVVWFPWEVYGAARGALFGQSVVVGYNRAGRVNRVTVDGKPVY